MKRIQYNSAWTDDEWREANFNAQERAEANSTGVRQPTADELISAAKRFGPEGILESAILLSQKQYKRVQDAVAKL